MPEHLPFPPPCGQRSRPSRQLSNDQQEKYSKVLAHLSDERYEVSGEKRGPLTEDEKFWLTSDCILRYLRASKWNLRNTTQRLEDTLKWRREYGLYDLITPEYVEPEAVTGKEIIFGYDIVERPAFLMIPSRQNTEVDAPRQLHYAVWMVERAIDLMGPGVETLTLLVNFADRKKYPSIPTALKMLSIIQNHYPERLGRALVINLSFIYNAFLKLVWPFVDPDTREKVRFNPDMVGECLFTKDNLVTGCWGGDREFEWNHEKYWPALVNMCNKRKEEQMGRWRVLGAKIGIDEWDIKGGNGTGSDNTPISQPESDGDDEKASAITANNVA